MSRQITFDLSDLEQRQAFQGLMGGLCKGARPVQSVKPLPVPEGLKGKLYSPLDVIEARLKAGLV